MVRVRLRVRVKVKDRVTVVIVFRVKMRFLLSIQCRDAGGKCSKYFLLSFTLCFIIL